MKCHESKSKGKETNEQIFDGDFFIPDCILIRNVSTYLERKGKIFW